MWDFLIRFVRILFGLVCLLNGLNWFFKIIGPYPSMSDFVDFLPPPDIVGALIDNGLLFPLAKAIELAAGIALLTNRLVPLTLVVAMSVTVPVFIVDVFKPELRLRAFLMGSGAMVMNLTLLLAYYHYYRPMIGWRADPSVDPSQAQTAEESPLADALGGVGRRLLPPLLALSALLGTAMVCWLSVMIVQYAIDPKALNAVHPLVPRH
jgi:hypothetical protein